jgi:hypothetical protein
MKRIFKFHIQIRIIAFLLTANFFWNISYAQNDQQQPEKKQAALQLSFYKDAGQSRFIVANVMAKNDSGKLVFVQGIKISFYASGLAGKSFLQEALTNEGGKARIPFPKVIAADTSGVTIIARLENDKIYDDTEVQASVKEASMVLSLTEKDSVKLITAFATEILANGEQRPLPGIEVSFGIKRLFGIMPLGEEATVTTDDQGLATFSFPKEINGDKNGNVVIVGKITDHDIYGNVEATTATQWGNQLIVEKNPFPRALWEPRAPIVLIVSFSIVFGGIWITYSIVIFQMIKIKRKKYLLNKDGAVEI